MYFAVFECSRFWIITLSVISILVMTGNVCPVNAVTCGSTLGYDWDRQRWLDPFWDRYPNSTLLTERIKEMDRKAFDCTTDIPISFKPYYFVERLVRYPKAVRCMLFKDLEVPEYLIHEWPLHGCVMGSYGIDFLQPDIQGDPLEQINVYRPLRNPPVRF